MEDTIEVTIKPHHFAKSTGFTGPQTCPLAQALTEMFPEEPIHVSVSKVFFGKDLEIEYFMEGWTEINGEMDKKHFEGQKNFDLTDYVSQLAREAKEGKPVPEFHVTLTKI